ncbi:MAG: serine/threonine-protein kinase [Myxococcota bacterium]|nr:serine/threonine-protein kinase [Myxococcota bacterium]
MTSQDSGGSPGIDARGRTETGLPGAPVAPDASALAGQVLGGRYRLIEVIGVGGMGVVYRGEHSVIERPVAVKVLLPEYSRVPQVRERFFREARVTNRIQHPSVPEVLDLGETDSGLLYLVMDFLIGETLARRMEAGPPPIDEVLDIALEVCDGLEAAHEVGVVHRDISPSNIFLSDPHHRGPSGARVRLLDFGIAFIKSETRLTLRGQIMGTPYYLAPEAIRGEEATPLADVYSLGAVMYEAVCGAPPFQGESYADILTEHLVRDAAPPAERRSGVPRRLDALIVACMAKDRAHRPQGVRAVAQEIHEIRREAGRRSRKSVPPGRSETATPSAEERAAAPSMGVTAWKEYLRAARGTATTQAWSRGRAAIAAQMEEAIADLERLDAELAARAEAMEDARRRLVVAEQRFGRAVEALRTEEAGLRAAAELAVARLQSEEAERRRAEAAFAEARSAVLRGERAEEAAGPGGRLGDDLMEAHAAAGKAAELLRERLAAERAARRAVRETEGETAEMEFQIEQLAANSSHAQEAAGAEMRREGDRIAELERSRAALWQRLIAMASALSDSAP